LDACLTHSPYAARVTEWAQGPLDGPADLGKAFPGQVLEVHLFVTGFDTSQTAGQLTYALELLDAAGETVHTQAPVPFAAHPLPPRRKFLMAPEPCLVPIGEDLPAGTYTLHATVLDEAAGAAVRTSATFEVSAVSQAEPFANAAAFHAWMLDYYKQPEPARALRGLVQHGGDFADPLARPWSEIVFFTEIFQANPWLVPHLETRLRDESLSAAQRARLLFLLGLVHEGRPASLPELSDAEAALFHEARALPLPGNNDPIVSPEQLDMLWFRFYATGALQPVQRIAELLALSEYEGTLRSLSEHTGPLSEGRREAALKDVLFQSARWSLAGNCLEHRSVRKFCIYLLQTGQLEEEAHAQLETVLASVSEELAASAEAPGATDEGIAQGG
jgi:hypothetical protein